MKNITRKSLVAFSAILLSSCTILEGSGLPVEQRPINVKTNASFNQFQLLGFQAVTFRTRNSDGEFNGGYCEITGNGYEANFLTPAIVMIPNFGENTGDMAIYCRYKDQPISNVVPIKKSRKISLSPLTSSIATVVGGPIAGGAVSAITDYATPKQSTNYGYDDEVTVRFN